MKAKHLLAVSLVALSAGSPTQAAVSFLDINTLTLGPASRLNMTNLGNGFVCRLSPFAQVYGYVVTAYDGGAWDGFGIYSSVAAADPAQVIAVGCISNAEAGYPIYHGRLTPTGNETFALVTYYGDANLDGELTAADLALMTPGGTDWYHGDFNYDGVVNAADYALLDRSATVLGVVVPEPATGGLLGFSALLLAARRRRGA